MTRRPNIQYSERELSFISANRHLPRPELRAAFAAKFDREDVQTGDIKSLCTRNGWKTGRTGYFAKGHVPDNKGKKMPFNAASAATQFKKGHVPANQKPFGDERICSKDGYILIKVDKVNPHTGHRGHYVHKHRHLWEQLNGPVPDGHFLKCLDSDKENTDPSNWECLPLSMKTRLVNGRAGRDYDGAPPEAKPAILLTAKLAQRISDIKKQKATK